MPPCVPSLVGFAAGSEVLAVLLLVQVGFDKNVELTISCPVPFDDPRTHTGAWCPGYQAISRGVLK